MRKKNNDKKLKILFFPAKPISDAFAPPPTPAKNNKPSWWINQNNYTNNKKELNAGKFNVTVKQCPSVLDILSSGYILKCPIDIYIDCTKEKISWKTPQGSHSWGTIGVHSNEQISTLPIDKNIFMKDLFRIHPLWSWTTPKGYSTLVTHPGFEYDLPFITVPGIIDSDDYFSDGLLSFFIKKDFKGVIKQGTPIAQIFPFKRDEFEIEIDSEFYSKKIINQQFKFNSVFMGAYKKLFWKKKVY